MSDVETDHEIAQNDAQYRCNKFHRVHWNIHMLILRHRSMIDLLDYLEVSMYQSLPFLNYPETRIIDLIFTAATVTIHGSPDKDIETCFFDKSSPIALSTAAARYMTNLFTMVRNVKQILSELDDKSSKWIIRTELNQITKSLYEVFGFLSLENIRHCHRHTESGRSRIQQLEVERLEEKRKEKLTQRRKGAFGELDDSIAVNLKNLDLLSEEEWRSREKLFGNSLMDKLQRDPWDYFLWTFKCAVKGCTKNDEIYRLAWSYWKNIGYLILQFYTMEWDGINDTKDYNCTTIQLSEADSIFLQNVFNFGHNDLQIGLDKLIKVCLIDNPESLKKIRPMVEGDLILRDTSSYIPCSLGAKETFSKLGLESISLRRSLLVLGYSYLTFLEPGVRSQFQSHYIHTLAESMEKLNRFDFQHFFEDTGHVLATESPLLLPLAYTFLYDICDPDAKLSPKQVIKKGIKKFERGSNIFDDTLAVVLRFIIYNDHKLNDFEEINTEYDAILKYRIFSLPTIEPYTIDLSI